MVLFRRACRRLDASPLAPLAATWLTAFAVLPAGCGSPESSFKSSAQASGGTTGAASSSGGGLAPIGGAGGVQLGGGGVVTGSGGIAPGAGGFNGAGGFVGGSGTGGLFVGSGGLDAGVIASGGASGSSGSDSGPSVPGDAGAPVNPFPSGFGFLISKACSDCASTNCQAEERVCAADPACVAVGQCIATCLGPTCLACITTLSNQATYNEFVGVTNCTDQKCQPTCPYLNIGGGGTNP